MPRPNRFPTNLLSAMKAILYKTLGDPSVLYIGDAPTPVPGPGELRIRIVATALNRADCSQRRGHYPPPPGASEILGLECAGEVDAVGEGVAGWRVGDRAMALLAGGGYAAFAVVPAGHAMPIPDGLSFEEAAAIPEAFLTASQALFAIGGLEPGGVALVHAGASGVGTAAIQLARWQGARVFATASAGKHALLDDLGVTRAIDYRTEDFAAVVQAETHGHGADVIVDPIGASYAVQNLNSLAMDGRWIVLATMGGAVVDGLDLRRMMARRATLAASTLRNRSDAYKTALVQRFAAECLPSFVRPGGPGNVRLRPVIDATIGWEDVADAHRRMEANATAGKIVMRIG